MPDQEKNTHSPNQLLTREQEAILALYLKRLDEYYEELKVSEKIQVEIETQHLKKILSK